MALGSVIIRPNSDGATLQLLTYPASPTTHYTKVDEVTQNGDGDYNYQDTSGAPAKSDYYGLEAVDSSGKGAIDHVNAVFCGKDDGGDGVINISLVVGASEELSGDTALTASYATYTYSLARPGGGAWTWADITGMNVGIELNRNVTSTYVRCTQVFVEIFYELLSTRSFTTE